MLFMVIFLAILFLQISSEDTFDCTGYDEDSFHPMYNRNDCRYYWHCIYVDTNHMRAIKRVCPAGTEFDIRVNECQISTLVNCVSMKSPQIAQTSRNTKLVPQIRRTTRPQQFKVLPNNSSPLILIEQLLRNLIQSSSYTIEPELDNAINPSFETTTTTPIFLTSKLKRRHLNHRHNLTLNILTSNEHKIRHFPINRTHGLLIHCNEIRRRQLRDLLLRTPPSIRNSLSKIIHSDILSLTIFLTCIFTKISD